MKIRAVSILVLAIAFLQASAVRAQFRIPVKSDAGDSYRTQANAPLVDTPVRRAGGEERITLLPKPAKPAVKGKKEAGKKKGKKPAEKPVSEYKFEKIDHVPAYTFDKKTNPIIKEPKQKKKPVKKKAAAKTASGAAPAAGGNSGDGKLQFPGKKQAADEQQPEE